MQSYSHPPMNPRDHPLASQGEMVEVFQTAKLLCILQHNTADVAFILPIKEVESGCFFLSGAEKAFVICCHGMLRFISQGMLLSHRALICPMV